MTGGLHGNDDNAEERYWNRVVGRDVMQWYLHGIESLLCGASFHYRYNQSYVISAFRLLQSGSRYHATSQAPRNRDNRQDIQQASLRCLIL
jgi:hypothetical protein